MKKPKILRTTWMATFHTCLTVGPIRLFTSFYLRDLNPIICICKSQLSTHGYWTTELWKKRLLLIRNNLLVLSNFIESVAGSVGSKRLAVFSFASSFFWVFCCFIVNKNPIRTCRRLKSRHSFDSKEHFLCVKLKKWCLNFDNRIL